jgi:hypothetical protein
LHAVLFHWLCRRRAIVRRCVMCMLLRMVVFSEIFSMYHVVRNKNCTKWYIEKICVWAGAKRPTSRKWTKRYGKAVQNR